VLDQVVSSSMAYFNRCVANDPEFESFASRWTLNSFARAALIEQIGCMCSVAAHLLRCSDATRKAKSFDYPDSDTQAAFVAFAEKVDATHEGLERLSILSALERVPTAELRRHNLLCLPLLNDVVAKARRARPPKSLASGILSGKGVGMWWPLPAPRTPFTQTRKFFGRKKR
jgi:hypothetical protein